MIGRRRGNGCRRAGRYGHAADEERRRLGGDPVHVADGQSRRLVAAVEGDAVAERLQDLRPRHGRPGRRHAQRGRPLAGSLQEIAAGDGRRHAARPAAGVLPALSASPSCAPCRRASWNGAAGSPSRSTPGPDDTHYRVIDWDEALRPRRRPAAEPIAPDETFFYASGRSSNEAGFLLQLFARLYGTNYVNNCSFYCHQASGVGLTGSLGTGTATVTLEDVENADLFFLIGGNPASNHPRLMRTLMNIRRRGGQVIVINPVKELGLVNFSVPSDVWSLLFGSKIASLYVQPHIGGDMALLTGVAKLVLERNAVDPRFIAEATEGFDAYRASRSAATSWENDRAAAPAWTGRRSSRSPTCICAAEDVGVRLDDGHHAPRARRRQRAVDRQPGPAARHGRPAALRACCRSAGTATCRASARWASRPTLKQTVLDNLETHLKVKLPSDAGPGHDGAACRRPTAATIRSAFCLGGNLFGSNPDAKFAARALAKLDLITYLSTTLNTGHAWGRGRETLILPVLARDEEPQPTTQESMFNFVRLSDGGPARLQGPRSEVDVIGVARRTGARRHVAGGLDGAAQALQRPADDRPDRPRLRADRGHRSTTKQEFQIGGRIFHAPRFPTPSGKAQFKVHAAAAAARRRPAIAADDGALGGPVQHGGLRGGGHLSRPGSARRDPDEPRGHRPAGPARRSARDGAQRGRRPWRTFWSAPSTSGPATP